MAEYYHGGTMREDSGPNWKENIFAPNDVDPDRFEESTKKSLQELGVDIEDTVAKVTGNPKFD